MTRGCFSRFIFAATCVTMYTQVCAAGADDQSADAAIIAEYEAVLAERDIRADAAGIARFLEQLRPDEKQAARIAALIRQLGADAFATREAASKALMAMPIPPLAALREARDSDDPEIAWRAGRVLDAMSRQCLSPTVTAALGLVRLRKLRGLTKPLLAAAPLLEDEPQLLGLSIAALRATVTEEDLPLLIEALHAPHAAARRISISVMGALKHPGAADAAAALLSDPDVQVRLVAARIALNAGDRGALAVLVAMLDDAEVDTRTGAALLLRAATGRSFNFIAYDAAAARAEAVKQWRDWLAAQGRTAALHLPVPDSPPMRGHTLICLYQQQRVIELDAAGRQILEIKEPNEHGPWGAQRLPNGHTLITWYSSHNVIEYDASGKEVWRYSPPNGVFPWNAHRLPNGRTLVAQGSEAVEVDRAGKIVWRAKFAGSLADAARLPNGHTMAVVSDGSVVEVNRDGEEVWALRGLQTPYRVHPLPNGNVLVTEYAGNRVAEFNRNKQVVWERAGLQDPDSAQRLPDGRTLVTCAAGVYLFDAAGKEVWHHATGRCIAVRY